LSAVIRHAFRLIMREIVRLMKEAEGPRERISAVIAGNFPSELFNRETAAAWISFYAEVSTNQEFERLQDTFYRRLHSNLMHTLRQLTAPAAAEAIALGISVWIDGLWLRCAMKRQGIERRATIRAIEEYVDNALARAPRASASRPAKPSAKRQAARSKNRR